jgi:hypothetical protein
MPLTGLCWSGSHEKPPNYGGERWRSPAGAGGWSGDVDLKRPTYANNASHPCMLSSALCAQSKERRAPRLSLKHGCLWLRHFIEHRSKPPAKDDGPRYNTRQIKVHPWLRRNLRISSTVTLVELLTSLTKRALEAMTPKVKPPKTVVEAKAAGWVLEIFDGFGARTHCRPRLSR